MIVRIVRLDKSLPLPKFETTGAVAFDLIARIETVVPSKEIVLIPSNNIIDIPQGYALVVAPRSSTPRKTGLIFPHSIGIIDQDYCGPEDEIMIQVYNPDTRDVVIKRGDKIAQGMFVRVDKAEWEETEEVKNINRGGFGTTDKKVDNYG